MTNDSIFAVLIEVFSFFRQVNHKTAAISEDHCLKLLHVMVTELL